MEIIISAFIGLVTGAIGSLIAPWVIWGIEKRKRRLDRRQQFIERARAVVNAVDDRRKFCNHEIYTRLRPYLSKESLKFLDYREIIVNQTVRGEIQVDNYKPYILKDILDLEKKWKLI